MVYQCPYFVGASVVFVVISASVTYYIDDDAGGLRWGKKFACLGAEPWVDDGDEVVVVEKEEEKDGVELLEGKKKTAAAAAAV